MYKVGIMRFKVTLQDTMLQIQQKQIIQLLYPNTLSKVSKYFIIILNSRPVSTVVYLEKCAYDTLI